VPTLTYPQLIPHGLPYVLPLSLHCSNALLLLYSVIHNLLLRIILSYWLVWLYGYISVGAYKHPLWHTYCYCVQLCG